MLTGKNAVITGANRGIGRATVEVFASQGANIWACARTPSDTFENDMRALAETHHVWIKPMYFEMTDTAQMKEAVACIRREKLPIDVLVNNAGMSYDALLPMLSMDKVREMFEVNFFSHVQLTQWIGRMMMKQQKGCIVNISSYLAEDGNRGQSMYSATKAAMSAFTKSLAKELAEYGIRVNAVAPGVVDTDLIATMSESDRVRVMERCAMHRPAQPSEIGNVVAMLASDFSSYVNGQIVRIDGCF